MIFDTVCHSHTFAPRESGVSGYVVNDTVLALIPNVDSVIADTLYYFLQTSKNL
jgi:hypothetical protein